MNRYYTQTLIPTPKVDCKSVWPNDPTDPIDTKPRWKTIQVNNSDLWSEEIYNKLKLCNLIPRMVRVFRWAPNNYYSWHVDGDSNNSKVVPFAINWIVEGAGLVQWNPNLPLNKPSEKMAYTNLGYYNGSKDDAYEEQTSGHGCILNTEIIHRVINLENIHRLSISIMFDFNLNYCDTVNNLKQQGLIV
jgi:hypothetical protein